MLSWQKIGGGLRILDITNPPKPLVIGGYFTGWPVVHVGIVGESACLIDGSNARNLAIIDISLLNSVKQITGIYTPSIYIPTYSELPPIYTVAISGTTAYVAGQTSIYVTDISNPATPKLLANYPNSSTSIHVAGNILYVSTCNGGVCGLQITDVTNPAVPKYLSFSSTSFSPYIIGANGNFIYLLSGLDTFIIANVSNPVYPIFYSTEYFLIQE